MAKRKNNAEASEASAATVGYEAQLWQMADALREQQAQAAKLDAAIAANLKDLGYGR